MDPRERRTYIKVHDGMPDHPKIDGLTDAAFRVLVELWCWSSRHSTDGHVPAATWRKKRTPKIRKELADAGLVHPQDDGSVIVHDYLVHQRSRAEIEAAKERNAANGRAGGLAKGKRTAKQVASESLSDPPSENVAKTKHRKRTEEESEELRSSDASAPPSEPTAQQLVAEWIDLGGGVQPDKRLKGQVSQELKRLLDEGVAYEHVQSGLRLWHEKNLAIGALKSCVHGIRTGTNGRPSTQANAAARRPSTTDSRVQAALDLAAELAPGPALAIGGTQ